MMMRFLASFLSLTIASSCLAALEPGAVQKAAAYSSSHGGRSLLIVQDGRTLESINSDSAHKIYSGTKAFWGLAALAAAQDGLLNLDERVAETIPSWKNDSRKARVTIRQLLDFSAGLETGFFLHNNDPGDRDRLAVGLPLAAAPGSAFIYGPGCLQVFHQVLKDKLHGQSPTSYLERRVLSRLGLGSQRYLNDRAGNPLLAAGWELTARQWSHLGNLGLTHGAPVVSSESFAQVTRGSSANRAFAFGWWNNRAAPGGREFDFEKMLTPKWQRQDWHNACICRDAPSDMLVCIGSAYQRMYVIPSLNLVTVRHGNGSSYSDAAFLRLLLGRHW
jgi:CubicO group peptidase (beta-lactamase class C family)